METVSRTDPIAIGRKCSRGRWRGATATRKSGPNWAAASAGYLVLASDGRHVGVVDHVRYERHADHPDEIVVRRRNVLVRRWRAIPFDSVRAVDQRERTVTLRIDSTAVGRASPP